MKRRHRGVLIDQGGWLKHSVGTRMKSDGVDQAETWCQPGWSHGEAGKHEDTDGAGEHQRRAIGRVRGLVAAA